MLKFNNQIILNAWDFQKYFSPWEALRQLEDVTVFARVHCQKLATVLTRGKGSPNGTDQTTAAGRYGASYLTKEFWIALLEEGKNPAAWRYTDKSVKACFQDIIKSKFEEYDSPEQNKAMLQELADARMDAKLQYIISSGKLTGAPQDIRTAVLLLALCELAEADVFAQSFRRWELEPAKPKKPQAVPAPQDGKSSKQITPQPPEKKIQAEYLPEAEVLRLETRGIPYSFFYYEKEELEKGHTIRSVRLEAVTGRDKSKNLTIQLVHPNTNQVILSAVLNAGEFRDCTAVDGKIVKLLPTMSISKNLCVARKQGSERFEVVPYGSDLWTIDMNPDKARSITCLAAGDEQEQGFLFVGGGQVITSFFKPCEDYFVRMEMQMITDTIVEARIEPNGYCLLTNSGYVISDIPQWNGRKNLVSLSDAGRQSDFVIENMDKIVEVVMNESQDSLAVRDRQGKMDVIFADDPSRSFRKTGERSIRI